MFKKKRGLNVTTLNEMAEVVITNAQKRKVLLARSNLCPLVEIQEVKAGGSRKTSTCVTLVEDEIPAVAEQLMRATSGRLAGPFEQAASRAAVAAIGILRGIQAGDSNRALMALTGLMDEVDKLNDESADWYVQVREIDAAVGPGGGVVEEQQPESCHVDCGRGG